MAAPRRDHRWNYQDLIDLPSDDVRRGILDWDLYEMTPPGWAHQTAAHTLTCLLGPSIQALGGSARWFPPGALLGRFDPVELDLIAVLPGNPGAHSSREFEGGPDPVVEVGSPCNLRRDEVRKRRVSRAAEVRVSWLIDPETRTVEVPALVDGDVLGRQFYEDGSVASALLPGLAIAVSDGSGDVDAG